MTLADYANPDSILADPTIAAGDFTISKDGGTFANLNTLPSVSPASSGQVRVLLSSTEMNADEILIRWKDQTVPPQWVEASLGILTTA